MGIVLIIFIVTLLVYLWSNRNFYWLSWKLKGPIGLPFVGVVELLNTKATLRYMTHLTKTYQKPTTFWLGPICSLYVSDPENVERIMKAPECVNRSIVYNSITNIIGEGLLSNNNPKWGIHRKLLSPVFNYRNLMSFFPVFNSETDVFCRKLERHADTNKSINIKDFLERFTLNVACRTTMGVNRNIQDENIEILKACNCALESTAKEVFNLFYRFEWLGKLFDPKFYVAKHNAVKSFKDFIRLFVVGKFYEQEVSPNSMKIEDTDKLTKPDFIFIHLITDLARKKLFSMDDVMSESSHILFAAYETTSKALQNIITFLAIHPEWQDKLYEEVKQVFHDKNSDVLYEHIQDVPLVEMIINETLRLLPVVPILGRQSDADFQLNDDIFISKATNICVDIYSMHRNPKYWGPNALQFNPDNFLPDAIKSRPPYVFMPFSKGLRNCLGWRYAYFLLKIFVIKVFRNYRFTTTTKMEEIEIYFNITAKLKFEPVFEVYTRE